MRQRTAPTSTSARAASFRPEIDLDAGRLIYALAPFWTEEGHMISRQCLAITPRFIFDHVWSFPVESLVFLNVTGIRLGEWCDALNGAGAGLDAAPQRAEQFERRRGVNLHHVALVGQRVGRERRLAEEMAVHRSAVFRQGVRLVGAGADEVQVVQPAAVRRRALLAGGTLPAGDEAQHHVVTRLLNMSRDYDGTALALRAGLDTLSESLATIGGSLQAKDGGACCGDISAAGYQPMPRPCS